MPRLRSVRDRRMPNTRGYTFQSLMRILFDQVGMGVNFSGISIMFSNGHPFGIYYDSNQSLRVMYIQLITIATKTTTHSVGIDTANRSMLNYGMFASKENGLFFRRFPKGPISKWKYMNSRDRRISFKPLKTSIDKLKA